MLVGLDSVPDSPYKKVSYILFILHRAVKTMMQHTWGKDGVPRCALKLLGQGPNYMEIIEMMVLSMAKILHHLGCMKPREYYIAGF